MQDSSLGAESAVGGRPAPRSDRHVIGSGTDAPTADRSPATSVPAGAWALPPLPQFVRSAELNLARKVREKRRRGR